MLDYSIKLPKNRRFADRRFLPFWRKCQSVILKFNISIPKYILKKSHLRYIICTYHRNLSFRDNGLNIKPSHCKNYEDKMTAIKDKLKDFSFYRRTYILTLFFCNVSCLKIPAYMMVFFMFLWGVSITKHKQKTNNTFFKLRFGLWVWGFLLCSLITMLINFSVTIFISAVMFAHVLICFFIFYGMHTEADFNFKEELYFVARSIVYITTVANIIGIICLMCNFSFEWYWIKFTIYENRFTGVYINPNLLGFSACVSIFCCHMLTKPDFISAVSQKRVSRIWIASCAASNLFSLLLCDSNASMVLILAYTITYMVYEFFASKEGLSAKTITLKIISLVLVGTFFVFASVMFREICQQGFASVTSHTYSFLESLGNDEEVITEKTQPEETKPTVPKKEPITFEHENQNLDSGRFKLYKESRTCQWCFELYIS